jgi:hypothetical protein
VVIVIDDNNQSNTTCAPEELQQKTPRKTRVTAMGLYYLIGSAIVSGAILLLVVGLSIHDARLIRKGDELAREGRLVSTNDVQIGGQRRATVFYSFTYEGQTYRGDAFLPEEHLAQVEQYCKSGSFPILFLPNNPFVNHPSGWHDTQSVPLLKLFLFCLVVIQWYVLSRFIRRDLCLARNGAIAVGRVTGSRFNRSGAVLLKYEFRDMDGLLTEGQGEYPRRVKNDAQICVLYMPAETSKSRPYPLVFFRAAK